MASEEFEEGFMLALILLGSMGHNPNFDDVVAQLVSVARGELSLQPTPEEAIRSIEADAGKPLPASLRASVYKMQSKRASTDALNQKLALKMLKAMGVDPNG